MNTSESRSKLPQTINPKHNHGEAFALMTYRCETECHTELLWNSRDGVTPFGIMSRDGAHSMLHWRFDRDIYAPSHRPQIGDRIFVAMTPERAAEHAVTYVERIWDAPSHPASQSGHWATKEECIGYFGAKFYGKHGVGETPDLITVDQEWLEAHPTEPLADAVAALRERVDEVIVPFHRGHPSGAAYIWAIADILQGAPIPDAPKPESRLPATVPNCYCGESSAPHSAHALLPRYKTADGGTAFTWTDRTGENWNNGPWLDEHAADATEADHDADAPEVIRAGDPVTLGGVQGVAVPADAPAPKVERCVFPRWAGAVVKTTTSTCDRDRTSLYHRCTCEGGAHEPRWDCHPFVPPAPVTECPSRSRPDSFGSRERCSKPQGHDDEHHGNVEYWSDEDAPVPPAGREREGRDADRLELLRGDDMRAAVQYLSRTRTLNNEDLSAVAALLMELARWRSEDAGTPVAQKTQDEPTTCVYCGKELTADIVSDRPNVCSECAANYPPVAQATEPIANAKCVAPRGDDPLSSYYEIRARLADKYQIRHDELRVMDEEVRRCAASGFKNASPAAPPVGEGEGLKACPFCDGAADPKFAKFADWHYQPGCMTCGATAESNEAWNRRAAPPLDTQALAEEIADKFIPARFRESDNVRGDRDSLEEIARAIIERAMRRE